MHLNSSDRVSSSEEIGHKSSKLSSNTENHDFVMIRVALYFNTDLSENSMDSRFNRYDLDFLLYLSMSLLLVLRNAVHECEVFLVCDSGDFR